ncbi:F-box/FBD/LRR-repeat protein At1g13570-like [Diospyros lotus]|uniref:F-box/FBD/LRR-repeat protein At1g13570-like n=1 Tax=Diospyros lotus TaxID=55363 RepID=UPI0022568790|nr:F-box/FBD/LRR-repeat protein At1g13570-like [Diospyros lotus]XP_052187210.1 F-box/FBD/LRR-repeat protein At1g13570-like [Diospyros lotus]
MKKMEGSSSDRISHLPADVKEKILMCLPMEDAVRTSILSKKWRHSWVTLPQLVFNDKFCRKARTAPKNELLMAIYQVLLHHRGPILKFELSMCSLKSCSEIDQLIPFVSNNDLQELILHIQSGEPYKLPSSFFSCLQLKHLELRLCSFNPPRRFGGFSMLLSLELQDVAITSRVLSGLIHSCPRLEKLKLGSCKIFSFSHLEIIAPKLKSLNFDGKFRSLSFKNTPKLERVSLLLYEIMPWERYEGRDLSNWVTLFSGLPAMEFLELDYGCLQLISAGGIPERLPTTLSNLKILELSFIRFEHVFELSSIFCLIRSSPHLEKLTIGVLVDGIEHVEIVANFIAVEGWSADISLNQLKEVEMRDVWGTRAELEFIKLLLGKSPVLEKMVIETNGLLGHEAVKFLSKVMRFKRLSPLAEVYYSDPDEDLDGDYYDQDY